MISTKTIKELAKQENKKIGKEAIDKIEEILTEKAKEIIKDATMEADFSGRQTIKKEDIE